MDDVLFARSQMGMSLAFHIVFACVGIAMPVLMVVAEVLYRRRGDEQYLQLAKLWSRGTAVLFAVGAVSGTVLSFELGLLFPEFMRHAGPVIGMPFSLEGFAFFIEAIFLGLYLYGWRLLSPALHVFSGVMVALSGLLSAVFVTIVNAWMNAPRGFRVENGVFVDIDPLAAMANPFAVHEVLHMAVAAYMATAFAAAALHAWALLRNPGSGLHRKALAISLGLAVPMALVQPLIGHYAGQVVAREQPVKLAAMEGLEKTQTHAPIHVGPVRIPAALSILAFNDPAAEVKGLEIVPEADRPHAVVRPAFQLMVLLGTLLAALSVWAGWLWLRKRPLERERRFLQAVMLSGPLGFIALEAGWTVTELGRQPWTIYNVLRTSDAATPMKGLVVPFVTFSLVYLGLTAVVVLILSRQVRASLEAP